jgi:hypothetical protein
MNKDQRRQKRKAKKRLRKTFLPRFVTCHYLRLPQIIPPTAQDLLDAFELARDRDKWLKLPFQQFPDIPSEEHQCWRNVERVIAEHGGSIQCGWYMTLSPFPPNRNSMNDIEMIPHGVWRNPAGALIEVSHDCRGGLFVASSVVVPFKGMNVGFVDTEFYARTYRPSNPALQPISGTFYVKLS